MGGTILMIMKVQLGPQKETDRRRFAGRMSTTSLTRKKQRSAGTAQGWKESGPLTIARQQLEWVET